MTLEELIDAIGPGFHPDTPGADYATLPEGVTPKMVDDIVDRADNLYQRAFERFIMNDWIKISP